MQRRSHTPDAILPTVRRRVLRAVRTPGVDGREPEVVVVAVMEALEPDADFVVAEVEGEDVVAHRSWLGPAGWLLLYEAGVAE